MTLFSTFHLLLSFSSFHLSSFSSFFSSIFQKVVLSFFQKIVSFFFSKIFSSFFLKISFFFQKIFFSRFSFFQFRFEYLRHSSSMQIKKNFNDLIYEYINWQMQKQFNRFESLKMIYNKLKKKMYELKNIRRFKNENWKKIEIFIKLKKRLTRNIKLFRLKFEQQKQRISSYLQRLNEISQQIITIEKKITSNIASIATFKLFRLKIEQRQQQIFSYLQRFDEILHQITVIEKKKLNVASTATFELNAFDVLIEKAVFSSLNSIWTSFNQ